MTSSLSITRRAPKSSGAETPGDGQFPVSTATLDRVAQMILDSAKAGGATAAEADVSQAIGLSVTVRKGEVETVAYNRDKGIAVTVFIGQRRGHASTADFADDSIRATVDKAIAIARFTADDPFAGLADPARLASDPPDLDLYHRWPLSVERAIELGRAAEAAASQSTRCSRPLRRSAGWRPAGDSSPPRPASRATPERRSTWPGSGSAGSPV